MSDAKFEIEQVLKLRQEGGSASAELNKTTAAVKQLNDESARYQEVLEQMRVSQVMETAGKKEAVKETQSLEKGSAELAKTQLELEGNIAATSAATEALTVKKKEWLKLTKLLPPEIHAIGTALKFVFSSPLVAVAAGLLFTLQQLVSVFREAREKLDALKLSQLNKDLNDVAGAASRNASNWASWDEALKKTGDTADDSLSKIRELSQAAGEVADAQFDLARAKVEADSSLTPGEKSQRLGSIAQQQSQSRANRSKALRQAEIAQTEKQLTAAQSRDENALAGRKSFSDASGRDAGALASAQQVIANADANIAKLEDKDKRVGLNAQEHETLSSYRRTKIAAQAALPDLQDRANSSASALADYTKGVGANRASIPLLTSRLESLRSTDSLRTQTEQQVSESQWAAQRTRNLGGLNDSLAQLIPGAAGAARDLQSGQSTSPANAQDYNALVQALKLSRAQVGELMKLLLEIYKDGIVTPEEMKRLRTIVNNNNQR
jgi:hypothetical protein